MPEAHGLALGKETSMAEPKLSDITLSGMQIVDGYAVPSGEPGIGIDWSWEGLGTRSIPQLSASITKSTTRWNYNKPGLERRWQNPS